MTTITTALTATAALALAYLTRSRKPSELPNVDARCAAAREAGAVARIERFAAAARSGR